MKIETSLSVIALSLLAYMLDGQQGVANLVTMYAIYYACSSIYAAFILYINYKTKQKEVK